MGDLFEYLSEPYMCTKLPLIDCTHLACKEMVNILFIG